MLRQAVNEIAIEVELQGKSPLLIKDGRYQKPTDGNDSKKLAHEVFISKTPANQLMPAIRGGRWKDDGFPFYIPGSSMRGAWRSHLEKLLRSLDEAPKVCDPMVQPREDEESKPWADYGAGAEYKACSAALTNKDEARTPYAYRVSCPVCQVFGNTGQASRLTVDEARKNGGLAVELDNVAVSRHTGSVISPFKSIGIQDALFKTEIRLRNFELWQVGLLGHLFSELEAERAPLGSGKNKGWGRIKAKATKIEIGYVGFSDGLKSGRLAGVAEVLPAERHAHYGYEQEAKCPQIEARKDKDKSSLWRHVWTVTNPDEFWKQVRPCLNAERWKKMATLSARRAELKG